MKVPCRDRLLSSLPGWASEIAAKMPAQNSLDHYTKLFYRPDFTRSHEAEARVGSALPVMFNSFTSWDGIGEVGWKEPLVITGNASRHSVAHQLRPLRFRRQALRQKGIFCRDNRRFPESNKEHEGE
jgi:hypothetical protein